MLNPIHKFTVFRDSENKDYMFLIRASSQSLDHEIIIYQELFGDYKVKYIAYDDFYRNFCNIAKFAEEGE